MNILGSDLCENCKIETIKDPDIKPNQHKDDDKAGFI